MLGYDDVDFGYWPAPSTPIGVDGEAYPVNKLAILGLWIALFVAVALGAIVLRRYRRIYG